MFKSIMLLLGRWHGVSWQEVAFGCEACELDVGFVAGFREEGGQESFLLALGFEMVDWVLNAGMQEGEEGGDR